MDIQVNNVKIIGWCWFNGRNAIGLIYCEDVVTKENKAYIGVGEGKDEAADLVNILSWGTKFPLEEAKKLVTKLGYT